MLIGSQREVEKYQVELLRCRCAMAISLPLAVEKKLYWLDYGVSSPAKHSERSRNYAGHASKLCDEQ
jgi:hypothetical protein